MKPAANVSDTARVAITDVTTGPSTPRSPPEAVTVESVGAADWPEGTEGEPPHGTLPVMPPPPPLVTARNEERRHAAARHDT